MRPTETTASPLIRPVAGSRSLSVVLAVLCVLVIATAVRQDRRAEQSESIQQRMFQVGWVYGSLSGLCWIGSATGRVRRWAIFVASACVASLLLAATRPLGYPPRGILLYLTTSTGLIISQSICFYLFQLPLWRRSAVPLQPTERQYRIADVLVATTAMAVLLALAQRYSPPIDPLMYWGVMVGIWVWLPVLSGLTAQAALRRRHLAVVAIAATVVGFAAAGAGVLARLEVRLNDLGTDRFLPLLGAYLCFAVSYVAVVATFALAGRHQAKIAVSGIPDPPDGP